MPAETATTKSKSKVAIIGKAPSSRGLAPYDDPSWEIWTLADLNALRQVPRWDRHFELHPLDWLRPNEAYWQWLHEKHGTPVYVARPAALEEIPDGVLYPLKEIVDGFGPYRYWTNSVSWMLALAIAERWGTIGVWGVDMATAPEYREQRPSCEYLIGWAQGLGIEVVIPPECDLLKHPFLYGFDAEGGELRKKWEARNAELQRRMQVRQQKLAALDNQRNELVQEVCNLAGALESQQYFEQWTMRNENEIDVH